MKEMFHKISTKYDGSSWYLATKKLGCGSTKLGFKEGKEMILKELQKLEEKKKSQRKAKKSPKKVQKKSRKYKKE
jgi:hypothetical protein